MKFISKRQFFLLIYLICHRQNTWNQVNTWKTHAWYNWWDEIFYQYYFGSSLHKNQVIAYPIIHSSNRKLYTSQDINRQLGSISQEGKEADADHWSAPPPCITTSSTIIETTWIRWKNAYGKKIWPVHPIQLLCEWPCVVSTAAEWVAMCSEHSCWQSGQVWWVQLLSEWPCGVSTAAKWVAMWGEYSCCVSGHVWWVQLLSVWPCGVSTAAEWVAMWGEDSC